MDTQDWQRKYLNDFSGQRRRLEIAERFAREVATWSAKKLRQCFAQPEAVLRAEKRELLFSAFGDLLGVVVSGMPPIQLDQRRRQLSREGRVEALREKLRWIAERISEEQLLQSEQQINAIAAEVAANEVGE